MEFEACLILQLIVFFSLLSGFFACCQLFHSTNQAVDSEEMMFSALSRFRYCKSQVDTAVIA